MTHRIHKDQQRFHDIVKSKIRDDLKKYINNQEMIGSKNGRKIRVPMPQIKIPKFTYGKNKGGVSLGDGKVGDVIDGEAQPGPGGPGPEPGDVDGEHELEVELDVDDLAAILGEQLQLPRIEPRGNKDTTVESYKYDNISRQGPPGLRHLRRSYKEALKRSITSGEYNPDNPLVIPRNEDWRYKSFSVQRRPEHSAAIVYMMDSSGSMDEKKKKLVRTAAFWLDAWITSQYKNVERVWLLHDVQAWETNEADFFITKTSGGTRASSVYQLCFDIVKERFPINDWNVYPFHFSDGDNWESDNKIVVDVVTQLLGHCNQFGYAEVSPSGHSGWSGWAKVQTLHETLTTKIIAENLVTHEIQSRDDIMPMLKAFLGSGR